MTVYTNQERREKILEFVKLNPKTTKSKVIEYMKKKKIASLVPTQGLLIGLIKGGKIKLLKDSPSSRNHYLIINDDNDYTQINKTLGGLEKAVNHLAEADLQQLITFRKTKNSKFLDQNFPALVQLIQYIVSLAITNIATSIEEKIKSDDDREFLFRKLVSVLISYKKLNNIIFPEIMSQITKMLEQLKDSKLVENYPGVYDNVRSILTGGYH
jgi:hypothetical protein